MSKDDKFNINTDWYELWMRQSKEFFESANKNLGDMFMKNDFAHPENHMKQIHAWLEALKSQWQFNPLNEQQKIYENYWKMMAKICNEASDMMVEQWLKRSQQQNPVKDMRELYELWLNCCHEMYQKSLQSKNMQEAYGNMMNAMMQFWRSSMHK